MCYLSIADSIWILFSMDGNIIIGNMCCPVHIGKKKQSVTKKQKMIHRHGSVLVRCHGFKEISCYAYKVEKEIFNLLRD